MTINQTGTTENLCVLVERSFLWARGPFCHRTIRGKSPKGTQNTNPNQSPGLNLSSSTNRQLKQGSCSLYISYLTLIPKKLLATDSVKLSYAFQRQLAGTNLHYLNSKSMKHARHALEILVKQNSLTNDCRRSNSLQVFNESSCIASVMHSHTTACWPCQLRTDVYCTKRWKNNFYSFPHSAFSALTLLVGGTESIRPVKNWVAWLSVWSEVQTCIQPSWCQCHSMSLASVKSRLVLPFWYQLTWVVPEKGPLNGCVCPHRTVNPWKVLNETNGDYSSGRLYTAQLNKSWKLTSDTL